jgi:hypothetical protein
MCLTCGCMEAHRVMGDNITYEDLKRIAEPPPLGRVVHKVQWALQQPGDEENRKYWEQEKRQWEEYEEQGMIISSIYQWRDERPVWLRTRLGQPTTPSTYSRVRVRLSAGWASSSDLSFFAFVSARKRGLSTVRRRPSGLVQVHCATSPSSLPGQALSPIRYTPPGLTTSRSTS